MIFQCILLNFTDTSFQYGSISGKMVFLDIRFKCLGVKLPRRRIHLPSFLSRWILDWLVSVLMGSRPDQKLNCHCFLAETISIH